MPCWFLNLPFLSTNSRAKDKPAVMLLGSQHGNEPSGTEVLQILARRLLDGDLRPLVSRMNFVVVALANPDGRDMNRRLNAKDEESESGFHCCGVARDPYLHRCPGALQPDVVMDLHETWNDKYPLTPIEGFGPLPMRSLRWAIIPIWMPTSVTMPMSQYLPRLIRRVSRAGVPAQRYNEIYSLRDPVWRGGLSTRQFPQLCGHAGGADRAV